MTADLPSFAALRSRAFALYPLLLLSLSLACQMQRRPAVASSQPTPSSSSARVKSTATQQAPYALQGEGEAIFAGGCFWCMEGPFERARGVRGVYAGYSGGQQERPTYKQVSRGRSDHRESVLVLYDPALISYEALLKIFWRSINPTQADGQFADIGPHYQSAVFYLTPEQERAARRSKAALAESAKFSAPIVTDLLPATSFWMAEAYHQDYYKTHPKAYARYRWASGRQPFLERIWGAEAH